MPEVAQFLPAHQIQKIYAVSTQSLRRWDKAEKIRTIRTPGNFRLYHVGDIQKLFTGEQEISLRVSQKKSIIYTRVSSNYQKEDLQRQIQDLQEAYPDHELIQDIGSGLNYKRKGFQRLLELVHQGDVEEIVVTHKDRLCRYGVELLEWLFDKHDVRLLVHCKDYQGEADPSRELADDLLAVCNFFVARNNGRRAADNKKRRRDGRGWEGREQTTGRQSEEDQVIPFKTTKTNPQPVARDSQVDL